MNKNGITVILCAVMVIYLFGYCSNVISSEPKLWLDKITFSPAEKIKVHFTAPSTFDASAWIGIIPSNIPHGKESVNDENDITYQHLDKKLSGVLEFNAPDEPGNYDFRMNDSDSDGKEVAAVFFSVIASEGKEKAPKLWLAKTTFKPGERIIVNFTAPSTYAENAWIGIIPSDIPHGKEADNDQNDVAYQYLRKKTSGFFTFTAPNEPGNYDLRMNDSDADGNEVASVSFTVK